MFRTVLFVASIVMAGSAMAQPWETKLSDDFEGRDFAPEGGLYYRENFEQTAGTVEFQNEVKHNGNGALKLSVVPTCPDSLDGCSERAEIWEKTALRVPYDQGVWYGFAVKFADPIPNEDHRYLIAQWKREIDPGAEGDFSPFLALRLEAGKLFATVETNYIAPLWAGPEGKPASCKPGEIPVWGRPGVNQMRMLVAADSNWELIDGSLFNACTDAIKVTNHEPRQSVARPEVRLDRFRDLHAAGSQWHGSHRTFRQRQADHHRDWPYRSRRQGARQEPVLQVRPLPGGRYHRLDTVLRRLQTLGQLRRRVEGRCLPFVLTI
jgi:hypothetical protein